MKTEAPEAMQTGDSLVRTSWKSAPSPSMSDREYFMSETARRVRQLAVSEWSDSRPVEMVGKSPLYMDLQKKVLKIAPFQEPVLITGESGVGKESLAQAIYLLGGRRGKPMISVNCPQYREGNLTVSELFGHKKGSFTGATADRQGCFEIANGGVIFLDEIGDLHMSAQVMLLRALANGEFQPLGSDTTRKVNVRVIAATNRQLDKLMVGEEFRHDLFFRLQYFLLKVPSLRERGDDWRLLLDFYLEKLYRKYGVRKYFTGESLKTLEKYEWPGNIRELISLTTTGYAMSDGDQIRPEDFVTVMNGATQPRSADLVETLYRKMVDERLSFWDAVHTPFLDRDLNRAEVRELIRRGLTRAHGSYRQLLTLFGLPEEEYQRFMDFLRHHRLKPDA
ncbi:MAG: sigma 54-interacting transcriptional regulator [Thermoanaerobaculia bacterium]